MSFGLIPAVQRKPLERVGPPQTLSKHNTDVYSHDDTNKTRTNIHKKPRKHKRPQKNSQKFSTTTITRYGPPRGIAGKMSSAPRSSSQDSRPASADYDSEEDESMTDPERWSEDSCPEDDKFGDSARDVHGQVLPKDIHQQSTFQRQLAADEAEIERLERNLGIKKNSRSLPQAFKDDGLDDILGQIDATVTLDEDESTKRKVIYDEWLSSKRRKTATVRDSSPNEAGDRRGTRGVALDESSEGFDSDSVESERDEVADDVLFSKLGQRSHDESRAITETNRHTAPWKRENPYVAPMTGNNVAKYVPPSKRQSDEKQQSRGQLQKKIQGLVNRLTDANLLSIVRLTEDLYQSNARGEVNEALVEAIMAQMRKPESLPDQFFVLTAGYCAAVFKIKGPSFGSHLLHQVVQEFSEQYDRASMQAHDQSGIPKEPANFLSFLTELYVFEVVGCSIIFDHLERLLSDLSEINVELLLRVCRMTGRLLRRDDPQALKHISNVLNTAVMKKGYRNISARTKYMVETIQGLQSSKPKAKGIDSAVVSEHVLRMKKHLGELKLQSRRLDGLTPMGIRLKDVESIDKHGKWWLTGASVPEYHDATERARLVYDLDESSRDHGLEDEDMDLVLPDYPMKARAQGLNTMAQIAIFTAIMSALDHDHGYRQFASLKLKKDEQLEIARVLVQCVGSEQGYNNYYALVAKQACGNHRIRFAFQDRLWRIFRGLGEPLFGEGTEDEHPLEGEKMKNERRLSHVAQFYASLIVNGALSITLLKPLDFPEIGPGTTLFVEQLLLGLLQSYKGTKGSSRNAAFERIFSPARNAPAVAAGLHWFLRKKLSRSKLISKAEGREMQRLIKEVQTVIRGSLSESP